MSAPRRWLDEGSGSTPLERELLREALEPGDDPPPHAQAEVWAALLARLPPMPSGPPDAGGTGGSGAPPTGGAGAGVGAGAAGAGAAGAAAGAGAASSGASWSGLAGGLAGAGVLKGALVGAGSALVLLAGYAVLAPGAAEPAREPPAVVAASRVGGSPAVAASPLARKAPAGAPEAAVVVTDPASPPVSRRQEPAAAARAGGGGGAQALASTASSPASRLEEESRLLGQARLTLREGNAASALGLLERVRARFPGGVLTQEREALTIEALYRRGDKATAHDRAVAFLEAYPSSPLAARVAPFAE